MRELDACPRLLSCDRFLLAEPEPANQRGQSLAGNDEPCAARDGVRGPSQAVAIVNHPRAARPRGAHWSPRGRSRGGPTLMPGATGVIRPRTIGGAIYRERSH